MPLGTIPHIILTGLNRYPKPAFISTNRSMLIDSSMFFLNTISMREKIICPPILDLFECLFEIYCVVLTLRYDCL